MIRLLPIRSPSLQARFVLLVFLGAVVPLGIVGWWLTSTTRRSGEELLRTRLEQTLSEIVHTVGINWVDVRSDILRLAELEGIQAALTESRAVFSQTDPSAPQGLDQAWTGVEAAVSGVTFYDLDSQPRGRYPPDGRSALGDAGGSVFPLRVAVYGRGSEGRIGTMEVLIRTSSLLPDDLLLPGLGGSVMALFDASGRMPLLPLTVQPELMARDRFTWADETWLAVRDTLYEPPLQLALAAPLGALGQPFTEAAHRGLIALVLVAVGVFILVTVAAKRIALPLERLADGADAVARGDLDRGVAVGGPEEIRRVASAFNTMTESLRRTLRELSQQESLAAVGEFAASLAHEVRNPLTAIRLDLQRARKHIGQSERASELVDHALREVSRLDASVTDGLRLARSGRPALAPLNLLQPLEAAFHAAEPRFLSRGARLQPPALPEIPVRTIGDAGALEQLFLNLLLNAADALGSGECAGVRFEVEHETAHVWIWDEGRGIPEEVMEQIFEPFYSTSPEGTGLGLPIARRIARAHGGDLVIQSDPDEGTTAQVTLPLRSREP